MLTLTFRALRSDDRDLAIKLASETEVFRPAELVVLAEVLDDYLRSPGGEGYHTLVAELADFRLAAGSDVSEDPLAESTPLSGPEYPLPFASVSPMPAPATVLVGFIIYGPTPLTLHTWDVYWIVVGKPYQRHGIGKRLLEAAEARIRAQRGEVIRVETSSLPSYEATRRFYEKHGYRLAGTIPDFYAPGDSLCIYYKRLASSAAEAAADEPVRG
jgi:ribosomal protein S18 acetylase RimI-like enzyme